MNWRSSTSSPLGGHASGDGLLVSPRGWRCLPPAGNDGRRGAKDPRPGPASRPPAGRAASSRDRGAAHRLAPRVLLARRGRSGPAGWPAVASDRRAAVTTASSPARRAIWAPAAAAKAWACSRVRGGRNTSSPTRTCRARPAPAPVTTIRALPRLGPRLQGRSAGLLQLQHRRDVHRMAGARRGCRPLRRQAAVGQREGRDSPTTRTPTGG